MTEVGPADRSRLLRSKRDEFRSVTASLDRAQSCDPNDIIFGVLTFFSSIVTSRKRKLRQLFAVATESDALPTNDFANPDAPPATAAEIQFLQGCDISQYVVLFFSRFFEYFWSRNALVVAARRLHDLQGTKAQRSESSCSTSTALRCPKTVPRHLWPLCTRASACSSRKARRYPPRIPNEERSCAVAKARCTCI